MLVEENVALSTPEAAEPDPVPSQNVLPRPADGSSPLVERVRLRFDVFHPFLEEMRPLMNDLRPIVNDARPVVSAAQSLAVVLLRALRTGVERAIPIVGPRLRSAGALAGDAARRAGTIRPQLATPSMSVSLPGALRMPAAPSVRVPTIGLNIGPKLRAVTRRLRPGRWALRTVAVSIIALAMSNPTVRGTMVEQVDAAASFVQTVQLPAIDPSKIELPQVELPVIEMPKLELPTIDLSKFELPAFQLPSQPSAAPARLAPATFELPPLQAYRAAFETQAAYPTVAPNGTVEWVVALRNTGSVGWYRGVAGAQASLALPDGTEAAVQSTPYVAPGQVGWFVVRFRAPAAPGTQTVALYPRIDGRGELPDLGLFTLVTVR